MKKNHRKNYVVYADYGGAGSTNLALDCGSGNQE